MSIVATYINTSTFTIVGDEADEFNAGRRVMAICSSVQKFCTVLKSSYTSPNTTVNLTQKSEDLNSGLTEVFFGIKSSLTGALPEHKHNGIEGEGGCINLSGLPKDLLIYYGYPSSFNYPANSYVLENVAKDMAQYNMIAFGDGIADTGHTDHANFRTIIARLKALKPGIKLFGYVSSYQSLTLFKASTDKWSAIPEMDGILLDECGYDWGTTRATFNEQVDYIHASGCPIVFANGWWMRHLVGTQNDHLYPNSTFNPLLLPSTMTAEDWYLLESFPVNTNAYASTNGYCIMYDWTVKGQEAVALRGEFGVKIANVSMIDYNDATAETRFRFHQLTALMYSLDAQGSSNTLYGSSVPIVPFYDRLNWSGSMGNTYEIEPSVLVAPDHWQKHRRRTETGKIDCDHTGADPVITFSNNSLDINKWSFAVNGTTQDAIGPGDVLDIVGGAGITVTRTALNEITISLT